MKYFVYEKTFNGTFNPVKYAEQPGKAPAGSHTPKRINLVKLKPDEENLSLEILSRIYPLKVDTPPPD